MARRRPYGLPVDGWLGIDKDPGVGSADVVAAVRRLLQARKAGHAGTLDRPATGVLAVALGEATKAIPAVMCASKTYRFMVRFGQATTTDDATGEIVAETDFRPETEEIEATLDGFRGRIMQRPPNYSAVKIAGKRASSLAAAGELPPLAERPLAVHRLELVARTDRHLAEFEMECGKGGYVRSIARDLGEALGCKAHVAWLRRTSTGPFIASESLSLEDLKLMQYEARLRRLHPLEFGLGVLPRIDCTPDEAAAIRNGGRIAATMPTGSEDPRKRMWVACQGKAVAMGEISDGRFQPRRVFVETCGQQL